jgi:hypothetical protein
LIKNLEDHMKQVEGKEDSVVAVYKLHPDAEKAITLLKKNNFNIKKLAIIGLGDQTKEQVVGYYTTGDRMKHWGKHGAFWGAMFALLMGSAVFAIPGIGLVMVAGSAVPWILAVLGTAVESAAVVGGLSALGAALYSFGIPKNSALKYESSVKAGKFVVIAHGTSAEVEGARGILAGTDAEEINVHESGEPAVAA